MLRLFDNFDLFLSPFLNPDPIWIRIRIRNTAAQSTTMGTRNFNFYLPIFKRLKMLGMETPLIVPLKSLKGLQNLPSMSA